MSPVRLTGLAALTACLAVAALAACSTESTPRPSPTPTLEPTPTPTAVPEPTAEPTATPTLMPGPTATPAPAATATPTPAPAPTPTPGPRQVATPAPQPTPTATAPSAGAPSDATLVMLADPLDEPEFYCVDVAGFGSSLNVNAPLQAHTCKPGADDEMFALNHPSEGQLYLVEHDRCIEAYGPSLYVRPCSESPLQRFDYGGDGTLRLDDGDRCLAVAGGEGEPAGGRSHLRRDLLMQPCPEAEPALSQWLFPGPSPSA